MKLEEEKSKDEPCVPEDGAQRVEGPEANYLPLDHGLQQDLAETLKHSTEE